MIRWLIELIQALRPKPEPVPVPVKVKGEQDGVPG